MSNTPDEIISEADSFWATPCSAYHVQYEPDQATIRKITELQDQIEATDAREFYRMAAHSLHMTVLTLFPATANVATQDNTPWSQHNETWFERIRDICASTRPFRVEFDAIRTTSRAIVLIGNESEDLKHFRQKIVTAVSLPVWKPTPPNIAHISLFRSARSGLRLKTLASIHRHGFVAKAQLKGIAILQELRYPSLERIFLQRFALG